MPSCEKCWGDAYYKYRFVDPFKSQAEHYQELIKERDCTPEEQAGSDATGCAECKRVAVHQIIKQCMACGDDSQKHL